MAPAQYLNPVNLHYPRTTNSRPFGESEVGLVVKIRPNQLLLSFYPLNSTEKVFRCRLSCLLRITPRSKILRRHVHLKSLCTGGRYSSFVTFSVQNPSSQALLLRRIIFQMLKRKTSARETNTPEIIGRRVGGVEEKHHPADAGVICLHRHPVWRREIERAVQSV